MKRPPRLRTAGLVLAALALPVVLAAATWTMTGTSLGGTVGVDDQGQSGPAITVTSGPVTTTSTGPPPSATTGPSRSTGDDRCDEPEHADDDRCTAAGASGSGGSGGSDDNGGRGRNRGHGGGDD